MSTKKATKSKARQGSAKRSATGSDSAAEPAATREAAADAEVSKASTPGKAREAKKVDAPDKAPKRAHTGATEEVLRTRVREAGARIRRPDQPGRPVLRGLSDIRRFFHRNETPIYYLSATNFNLLGIDEWVRNFRHVNHVDCFDGRHPNTFIPDEIAHAQFESIEDITLYLLRHPQVAEYVSRRARDREGTGKACFLMFDEECEAAARELGLEVWFPPASLRQRVDDKIETVRIGEAAGVPSVPNVLAQVDSWDELRRVSTHLGERLVVQTAFGDSGHTTFFIEDEGDWNRHADEIVGQGEVKIMKRIRCRGSAIEACATSAGTIVGPLMTELVGFEELTPYGGGWCGNEIFPGAFTPEIRRRAVDYTAAFGEQLRAEGYRGYFELDFLIDEADGRLYLGELNPRITGASSITNHAAFAHADAPLFLFHLLEFSGAHFELDVADLNARWANADNIDEWSQLVVKHVPDEIDLVTQAPESGIWRMGDDGRLSHSRFDYHRRAVETDREGFWLRITGPGDYRYEGADLGILVTRGRLMTDDFRLTSRARAWIHGLRGLYRAEPFDPAGPGATAGPQVGSGFKLL